MIMYTRIIQFNCRMKALTMCLMISANFFSGCAAIQSFPQSARSGETITLAVGSPEGMTKNNILVEYYSDQAPSAPYDITSGVQSVFKIYPDRGSKAWLYDDTLFPIDTVVSDAGHAAWLTVISLDLPALPTGTGKIKVTPTSPDIVYSPGSQQIDQVDISLEILPGTGTPNPLAFIPVDTSGPISRSLSDLEPAPQVIFNPPIPTMFNGGSTQYGAMEIVLTIPLLTANSQEVPDADIFVLLDDKGKLNLQSQISLIWNRTGDQFTIVHVSPKGMNFGQSRFSVATRPGSVLSTPGVTSIKYFDLNGAEIPGPLITDYTLITEGF